MQILETLRTYVKTLILEQKEREQSEEQEIDSIKDLFQRWIDEYKANYLIHRKKVYANSYEITQISVKELANFIYISLSFEEHIRDDWFIILYNKEDKKIYCTNALTLADADAPALAIASVFVLGFSHALAVAALSHYIEYGWLNKISADQFQRVMDVTRGNYAQFEVLINRLSEKNK
jgi:hypothetical protein